MSNRLEIDDAERWVVESTLRERYGYRVATQLAETELRLQPTDETLTECPSIYWEERGAAFVIVKVGDGAWRGMFFYPQDEDEQQFGAGKPEHDDLLDCVTALLRVQADHEKERQGAHSGKTGRDLA